MMLCPRLFINFLRENGMKFIVRGFAAASLLVLASTAQADVVLSYFNFNTLTTNSNVDVTTLTPNIGNGSLSENFNGSGTTAFSGSTINAENADPAEEALALTGGSSGNGTPNNGSYLQLKLSTLSASGLTLSFATQKSNTGFNNNQLQYSVDGGVNYVPFGSTYNPATSFGLQSFDLTSVAALNNKADVRFRIIFNGATNGTGNNRIDNLKVMAAVPAPSSLLSLCVGLPVVGFALRRRRK
jgi:hypothetical protein